MSLRGVAALDALQGWFAVHRRDLPWRSGDRTPWGVLVSEVMLQQTPVERVLPAWGAWLARWPAPADLAVAEPAEAVRQWSRLGYPRRALNLHRTAALLIDRHRGEVPEDEHALRALPGVGEYTAAAVRAFAFGRRAIVLDTNVRRVLSRVVAGEALPPPAVTAVERTRADGVLPNEGRAAADLSLALMELGALVCTATRPRCSQCPVQGSCAWVAAGQPPYSGPPRRVQRFEGTDRQARGRLLAVLRAHRDPVPREVLERAWADPAQRDRALHGLIADGLVEPRDADDFALPSGDPAIDARPHG